MLLVQNESLSTLLARLEGILGPIPDWMLQEGCFTHRYFTAGGVLYDQNEKTASFLASKAKAFSFQCLCTCPAESNLHILKPALAQTLAKVWPEVYHVAFQGEAGHDSKGLSRRICHMSYLLREVHSLGTCSTGVPEQYTGVGTIALARTEAPRVSLIMFWGSKKQVQIRLLLQGRYELLRPKRTSLKHRVPEADDGCIDFIRHLLSVDPKARPSAQQALQHPWLQHDYSQAT